MLKNDNELGGIVRTTLLKNCNPALSRFQEATLGQGQIEQNFLDFINASKFVAVKWNTCPIDLTVREEWDYPVRVVATTRVPGDQVESRLTITPLAFACPLSFRSTILTYVLIV